MKELMVLMCTDSASSADLEAAEAKEWCGAYGDVGRDLPDH